MAVAIRESLMRLGRLDRAAENTPIYPSISALRKFPASATMRNVWRKGHCGEYLSKIWPGG
jgi:hypothetical protein